MFKFKFKSKLINLSSFQVICVFRHVLLSRPDRRLLCMFLFLFGQGVIWVGILCLYV